MDEEKSVGSGAPAGFQVSLSPPLSPMGQPPEEPRGSGHTWGTPWQMATACVGGAGLYRVAALRRGSEALSPGFLNWFFPLIHLVLLSGVGWDHPPPAFGLYQHKGWHESSVLNMQPLQRTGLSPSQVVASFLTC